jgi:formate hydrogenlyase subunit 3/multisubunit Na+/H+ antiporter MnhD subunit
MPLTLALFCALGLLATGLLGVFAHRSPAGRPLVYGLSAIANLGLLAAGLYVLLGALAPQATTLPLGLPWLGAKFRLDALSALFLIVANLGGCAASVFGLGYGRHEHEPGRVLPFYAAFLAGMNLVVLADDAFTFLLSWEFMSLASWALVMAHHRERGNAHAGYVYIIMASFGTLALLLAFGLLAGADGSYGFDAIRNVQRTPLLKALVLVLALLGAGSKAGLVPVHAWLPLAHPAAPSHVSALMSGVMTKVAVYGFIRIVFDLLGPPDWWWSVLVLLLAGVTTVLGVLYALMEHDLKRLLAYHTVENIGIIFIGLGLALAFRASGMNWAAALALTAALFHVLNHMLFKSLLFFGAGAVLTATGERDMEQLGGLIKRMPKTAFTFLVGCAAISALPPLNGFVSEWLTFQAILVSPQLPQWVLKFLVPAVGAMLALSAALAATCFVKAFGITFLGRPRSPAAAEAKEVDGWSVGAMIAFAALCALFGILPGFVIDALSPAVSALTGARMPVQAEIPWWSIAPIAESRSSYNGLLVFAFSAISGLLAAVLIHRFASRRLRRAPAWDCGFPDPQPATQYTAGSFAQPIRRVFGTHVFAARESVEMPPPGDMRPARMHVTIRDLIWERLYAPVAKAVDDLAQRSNVLQFLTIRRYLTLVFFSLIILLTVLAIWR